MQCPKHTTSSLVPFDDLENVSECSIVDTSFHATGDRQPLNASTLDLSVISPPVDDSISIVLADTSVFLGSIFYNTSRDR